MRLAIDFNTPSVIYEVDPATGQLTLVGEIPAVAGAEIAGLAAASADLLYATMADGRLFEITVNPFGFVDLGPVAGNSA